MKSETRKLFWGLSILGVLCLMIGIDLRSQDVRGGVGGSSSSSGGGSSTVEGTTSAGSAAGSIKPILIGGNDGTNLRGLLIDSSGRPTVNINGTVPISSSGLSVEGTVGNGSGASSVKPLLLGYMNNGTLNMERVTGAGGFLRVLPGNDFIALGDGQGNSGWFASANTSGFAPYPTVNYAYNGSTWDRMRGSTAGLQQAGLGSGATGGVITAVNVCDTNAAIATNAGSTAVVVSLVSGRKIRICAISMSLSAAGSVKLKTGTGTTCGTGTADLTGDMALATGVPVTLGSGLGSILTTATAVDLCVTPTTGNVAGFVSYTIF